MYISRQARKEGERPPVFRCEDPKIFLFLFSVLFALLFAFIWSQQTPWAAHHPRIQILPQLRMTNGESMACTTIKIWTMIWHLKVRIFLRLSRHSEQWYRNEVVLRLALQLLPQAWLTHLSRRRSIISHLLTQLPSRIPKYHRLRHSYLLIR